MWFIGKLRRDKRGIGSLVGAAFLILILLSGFAFYMLNVNVTDEYRETLGTMDQLDLKRKQEKIEFVSVSNTTDHKLNITVKNTGPHQTHLIWLGVFDESLSTQKYCQLNSYINPAETEKNIGSSEPGVTITEGNKYVIQLVTELGNIVEYKFYPASEVSCGLTLMALPPTVNKGDNVTVLLIVTHNDPEVDAIQSLKVILKAEPTGLVEEKEEPSSLSVEGMRRGESAFFKWIYNTVDTGTVTFNATYDQAPTGTYALSTVEITEELYATISNVTQIVISNLTNVMGPILMDYKSLRWYSHETGHDGTWWINNTETKLEWFVNLTNFGDQDLTLKYQSAFAVFSVGKETSYARWKRWYIREEYLLPVGEPVEIGFCWNSPSPPRNYDKFPLSQDFLETCATFLLLIGEWADDTHFGENLPYQAIWVVD